MAGAAMICRRLPEELLPNPSGQVPIALEDDMDPGFIEGRGTQREEKLGSVLVVSARDLKAASPSLWNTYCPAKPGNNTS